MPGIVTLTTDFGTSDSYVGQMKGVLLATAMQPIRLVDITHEVPPQDIRSGARLIAEATPLYPPGSVHLAVVVDDRVPDTIRAGGADPARDHPGALPDDADHAACAVGNA